MEQPTNNNSDELIRIERSEELLKMLEELQDGGKDATSIRDAIAKEARLPNHPTVPFKKKN